MAEKNVFLDGLFAFYERPKLVPGPKAKLDGDQGKLETTRLAEFSLLRGIEVSLLQSNSWKSTGFQGTAEQWLNEHGFITVVRRGPSTILIYAIRSQVAHVNSPSIDFLLCFVPSCVDVCGWRSLVNDGARKPFSIVFCEA